MKGPVLVSACLLGMRCRYDGASRRCEAVAEEAIRRGWIPVCPEALGGLPTPRPASECRGDRVVNALGEDVTEAFRLGAEMARTLAELYGAEAALLKERSPSCGRGLIYDGSFTHTLIPGDGITARALAEAGIAVYGESQLEELLAALEEE